MKKFILSIVFILINVFCFSQEPSQPHIYRVFFEKHSYICFDGSFYIHDPDCKCDARWIGYIEKPNHTKENILLYRLQVTDAD